MAYILGFAEIRILKNGTRGSVRKGAQKGSLNRELMYIFKVRGAVSAPLGP